MAAYALSQENANDVIINASPVASAVKRYVATQHGTVRHTATELLALVNGLADLDLKKARSWPKTPHHFSGQLRRDAPALRRAGIGIEFETEGRGDDKRKIIILTPQMERNSDPNDPSDHIVDL